MAGLTNQIASAVAAIAAGVAGVAGASPVPVDSVPNTPFVYLGPPKWTQVGGSWETREYRFPMHYLIVRVGSEDRDQTAINDALDLMDAAFRSGITLGGIATSTLLLAADTDKFYDIGSASYQSIDFDVQVIVMSAQTYTP
jgi:hypothetical protein